MRLVWVVLLGWWSNTLCAQTPAPIRFDNPLATLSISNLDLVSIDTRDQVYASNTSGDVYLFDQKGKQINLFSPSRQGRLNQLEAAWTVNIFCFSTDLQEFRILDRFLNPLVEKNLTGNEILLPKGATLGNNNIIWVWDESDLSLKSLNYLQNQIIQSQALNMILDSPELSVTEIREFKNRVFMNIPESGIYLFDNQGNFLQKVAVQIDQRLCFYKENLFWVNDGKLKMYSLSEQETFDLGPLPSEHILSLQIGGEILTLVKKNQVEIYALPEGLKDLK